MLIIKFSNFLTLISIPPYCRHIYINSVADCNFVFTANEFSVPPLSLNMALVSAIWQHLTQLNKFRLKIRANQQRAALQSGAAF